MKVYQKLTLCINFFIAIVFILQMFSFSIFNLHFIASAKTEDFEIQEIEDDVDTSSLYMAEIPQTPTDTIPSKNYTIVLDAGHGGADPGSIGYKSKIKEADLNLKITKMLKKKLEEAGINIVLTRETNDSLAKGSGGKSFKKEDMKLREEIIKKIRPNMVISIHQNSYTSHKLRGAQVFYDKTSEISKQIAMSIQEEFLKSLDHSNKSVSPGDYFMLKCTYAPSVIVECGFLSNEEEEKLLLSEGYQEKIVNAIYMGIVKFLQIK